MPYDKNLVKVLIFAVGTSALVLCGTYSWQQRRKERIRKEVEQMLREERAREAQAADTASCPTASDTLKPLRKLPSTLATDTIDNPDYDADSYFQEHYDDYASDPEDIIEYPETDFDANRD